jgi:hypothetical protein
MANFEIFQINMIAKAVRFRAKKFPVKILTGKNFKIQDAKF